MTKVWSVKYLKIFIVLILVGLIVHYPSFKLSLYGDDWLTIYLFFTHIDPAARFGPLPGILTYLTPYGPSILLIGTLFKIFHTKYIWYYITALILRMGAAFCLFLTCQKITNAKFVSFLTSVLFLVGFTGLQTTDWVFYMTVYLATGFFLLGIFYKIKFFQSRQKKNLYRSLFFELVAIIVASVRLYPVIFLSPLIDALFFFQIGQSKKFFLKLLMVKNVIFVIAISLFWYIGVFGTPRRIYSPDWSIGNFLALITSRPIEALKSFFYWIGAALVPSSQVKSVQSEQIIGMLILLLLLSYIIKSLRMADRKNRVLLLMGSLLFFVPLVTIWWYAPLRFIGSEDRYLLFPFAMLCLFMGVLIASTAHYLRISAVMLLIFLIVTHSLEVRAMYSRWLDQGRSADYIATVDVQLRKDFPNPLKNKTIIYIEPDDAGVEQSTVFGIAFKIAVFSGTWEDNLVPNVVDEKKVLIKKYEENIAKGISKEGVISNVYGYKIKNKTFTSITPEIRAELLTL